MHPDLLTLVAERDGEIVGFVDAEVIRVRPEREPWESLGFVADTVRYALYD